MRSSFKLSGLVLAARNDGRMRRRSRRRQSRARPAPRPRRARRNTPKPSPSGPPAIEHPTGKDALVLRITIDGGFVPVG